MAGLRGDLITAQLYSPVYGCVEGEGLVTSSLSLSLPLVKWQDYCAGECGRTLKTLAASGVEHRIVIPSMHRMVKLSIE